MADDERLARELSRFWNELVQPGLEQRRGELPADQAETLLRLHRMTQAPLPNLAQARVDRAFLPRLVIPPAASPRNHHASWDPWHAEVVARGHRELDALRQLQRVAGVLDDRDDRRRDVGRRPARPQRLVAAGQRDNAGCGRSRAPDRERGLHRDAPVIGASSKCGVTRISKSRRTSRRLVNPNSRPMMAVPGNSPRTG